VSPKRHIPACTVDKEPLTPPPTHSSMIGYYLLTLAAGTLHDRTCRQNSSIISASLSVRIAEQSAIVIDHVVPSVSPHSAHVYCGKTADWIRMPFGVVSGVELGIGVLDFGGDRRRGRGSLGR